MQWNKGTCLPQMFTVRDPYLPGWFAVKSISKREFDTRLVLNTLISLLSWALSVTVSVYYTLREPRDGISIGRCIWDQNFLHPTGFTIDPHIVVALWFVAHILRCPSMRTI